MSRIPVPALDALPEASKSMLSAVRKRLGVVPNLYRLIGISPVALGAFTNYEESLSNSLDVKTRERIALAVAQVNQCDYCLSAHTYLGFYVAKMSAEEIALNRSGASADPKASAAVRFAAQVAIARGHVSDVDVAGVREAGFNDSEIVEIVALVAENSFTNYINGVAKTEIDFPVVQAAEAA
jgi:uncharacterized peroxidase-related enzyme